MIIQQTLSFKKNIKNLHQNQKNDLDEALKELIKNPLLGDQKKGDLSDVRVYKFKMTNSLTLLAYTWEIDKDTITLLRLGSHENFYRDLKN